MNHIRTIAYAKKAETAHTQRVPDGSFRTTEAIRATYGKYSAYTR